MGLFDIAWEVLKWIWENKNKSFTFAAFTSLLLILIDKFGRKLITNQLKRLFHVQDKSEFAQYKANQLIIMENQRRMMVHMGVEGWDAHYLNGKPEQNATGGQKNSLLQRLAAFVRAPITGASIPLTKDSYHSKTREGNIQMANKLLSRKFLLAVGTSVLIALNDALGWGFSQDTITAVVTVIVGWIAVEGATDIVKKKPPEVSAYDAKTLDSIRQDSEGA